MDLFVGVWLLSSFFFLIYIFFFSPFLFFVSVYVYASLCDFVCIGLLLPFVLGFCLFVFYFCFFLSSFSSKLYGCQDLGAPAGLRPEPPRWEGQVQDIGPPETSQPHIISIGESSPRDLHLNTKTQLHPMASKLQC